MKNPSIFVSYSSLDEIIVTKLANQLRSLSINCWMDVLGRIQPGELITENIVQAIKESDFLLCYLSSSSIKSDWVTQEVELAFKDKGGKAIIFLCSNDEIRTEFETSLINNAYPSFYQVRIPKLCDENFYKCCLEITTRIWQSYQSLRFPNIDIDDLLDKSKLAGISHIKYGDFSNEEDERFRYLLSNSKELKFLGFNGSSFIRNFSEELKRFFKDDNTTAKFLIAKPKSEFYDQNTFLVSNLFHQDDRDMMDIQNTILRLQSYLNKSKSQERSQLQIKHFNTELRNSIIIFDNKICHLTISIPPTESFKSITFEFNKFDNNSIITKCIDHFDRIWSIYKELLE